MEMYQTNTSEEVEEARIIPDSLIQSSSSNQPATSHSQIHSSSPSPSVSRSTDTASNPPSEREMQSGENMAVKMETLRQVIPAEPTTGRSNDKKWNVLTILGDLVRVRVVYPNGTKIQRNFLSSDKLGLLLDLVALDMYDNKIEQKLDELCLTVPRVNVNEVMSKIS